MDYSFTCGIIAFALFGIWLFMSLIETFTEFETYKDSELD